ncbi:transcription termination/antitermination protein NusA [Helicobacter sp. 16-1353]|uniref:transcription termination factor NusA n=1 Tax=Helicobacter sp. 16-1353 TaxID=2004996 RepID=UPI000DCCCC73|nr:transcription termination factor NusA [Helicobacter sp. 16-1353]RAX54950.1 transcription termination/antitermination protein NusA [Helicobacter sp. 16-1353]
MDKILDIIEIIAYEKGLQIDIVQNIVKDEILKLAKNNIDNDMNFVVDFDKKDKNIKLFYKLKVVDDDENISKEDSKKIIKLSEAKQQSGAVLVGDEILFEMDIDNLDFNRSTISNLLKDLENNIEKNIETQIFDNLKNSVDKIVNGMVVHIDQNSEDTIIELDSIRARLLRKNRIKGETFKIGQNISCILKKIYIDKKYGIQIELSRTTPKFLEELLKLEVPEISDGEVSIIKCSRIPGVRAKVAVQSNTPRVDAVGATVGVKGVRINAVSKKICGESIDAIEYSNVPEIFIANAISPAKITSVKIVGNEKAIISLHSDQKSKAIGKDGVNIRLASMLLGLELEINDIGLNPSLENLANFETSNQENKDTKDIKESGKQLLESLFKS